MRLMEPVYEPEHEQHQDQRTYTGFNHVRFLSFGDLNNQLTTNSITKKPTTSSTGCNILSKSFMSLVAVGGLEPPIFALWGRYSSQLNYTAKNGADFM